MEETTIQAMPVNFEGKPIINKVEYPNRLGKLVFSKQNQSGTIYIQRNDGKFLSHKIGFRMKKPDWVFYYFEVYLDDVHLSIDDIIDEKLKLIFQQCDQEGVLVGDGFCIANDVVQGGNTKGFIFDLGDESLIIKEDENHHRKIVLSDKGTLFLLNDYSFILKIPAPTVGDHYKGVCWKKSINQFRVTSSIVLTKISRDMSSFAGEMIYGLSNEEKNIFKLKRTIWKTRLGFVEIYEPGILDFYELFADKPPSKLKTTNFEGIFDPNNPSHHPFDPFKNIGMFCLNTNSFPCSVRMKNWRGYGDVNGLFPVRFPLLDINLPNRIENDLIGTFGTEARFSEFGMMGYNTTLWANSDDDFFFKYLHSQGSFTDITESTYSGSSYYPSDYNQWTTLCIVLGFSGAYVFLQGYVSYDSSYWTEFFGYYHSTFRMYRLDDIGASGFWREPERSIDHGYFYDIGKEIDSYTEWSGIPGQLQQNHDELWYGPDSVCFVHNGKIVLFRSHDIRIYDFSKSVLLKEIPYDVPEETSPGFVEYVEWNNRMIFVVYFDSWTVNPFVSFFDADTLDPINDPPQGINDGFSPFGIFNFVEFETKLVRDLNYYRSIQPPIYRSFPSHDPYYQPISFLGFSIKLCAFAKTHIEWCIANNKMAHIDKNDTLNHYSWNLLKFQDVLAIFDVQETDDDEVEQALNLWKTSPDHWASLMNYDNLSVGWYIGTFPKSTTEIQIGPGLHLGGTSYTTDWTKYVLPEGSIGKLRIICVVLAAA
jgi:hypothetical protein